MMKRMGKNISKLYWIVCITVVFSLFADNARLKENGGFSAPYFQADYIQELSEVSASMINPALTYRVNQMRFEVGGYRWGGIDPFNDLGYQQATFLLPIGLRHTAGVTLITSGLSSFDISEMNPVDFQPNIIGKGNFWERWIIGHYGAKFLPWLALGANPKLVIQDHFGEKTYGFGLDFAVFTTVFNHYRFGDLGFSFNFQDIIPANLKWKSDSGEIAKQLMTTRLRMGLRYSILNDKLIFDAEGVIDNIFKEMWDAIIDLKNNNLVKDSITPDGDTIQVKLVESWKNKVGRISAHVRYQWIPQLWFKVGWANNNIPYIGFNFNVMYLIPDVINFLSVDLNLGYSLMARERGTYAMVKLATDFGPTREQLMSKRMYDKLVLAPANDYNEAMRLYSEGRYWEASFAFGKVLALYPNFHLSDKATYYLGDCYLKLRLNKLARTVFKEGLATYPTSNIRANLMYGLEQLDYREGNYKSVLKNHAFISNLYSDSPVKPDADYIAGETHFLRKNYSVARQLLSGIKKGDNPYYYAQYTLAVINIIEKKIDAAIINLNNIISLTTEDPDLLTLKDAAYLKLGQLYYEQVELKKAFENFTKVSENTRYADDALLGIAWTLIKVKRPVECLNAVEQLISKFPESPLIPEAWLVKGYAHLIAKQYRESKEAFEQCLLDVEKKYPTEDDLELKRNEFEDFEYSFEPTAIQIKKNALRKPTDKIIAERTELKNKYDEFALKSRELFVLSLKVDDSKEFFRRKEDLIADANYALAHVSKLLGTEGSQKVIEKTIKKKEKIDSEIQKIQQELQKLENSESEN